MQRKGFWIIVLIGMILVGCLALLCLEPAHSDSSGYYNIDTDPLPFSQEVIFQQLFSQENKVTVKLLMEEAEIAKMQADHEAYSSRGSKSPIYRMADLEITIVTRSGSYTYLIPQVGVRQKGNTSRTSFYSPEEGIYNLIHLKLSFQETFDAQNYYGNDALKWSDARRDLRKDRTFATLEKLDMRWNKCDDSTYIKELYAYEMYRHWGVLAPHANLASVDWNQLHMGVYTICEPVDNAFLEKHLPGQQQGGDLYKCGWSHTGASFTDLLSIGIEDEDAGQFYSFDLKNNKKTSAHSALTHLITGLNGGAVTKEQFARLVDVDYFLNFAAVSYFLGNPDDLRNNYNNCYIYFRKDTGQMLLIPYDYDRCLGVTQEWNPSGDGVTSDDPFTTTLAADGSRQRNPLYLYSICPGGFYVREYAARLEEISQSKWLQNEHFLQYYDQAALRYQDETVPGKVFSYAQKHSFCFDGEKTSDFSSQGNISFREYVQAKQNTLQRYLPKTQEYASGTPVIPADCFIRADFTGWDIQDDYIMKKDAQGCYRITLSRSGTLCFKVYIQSTDRWYGSEALSEDSLSCDTDGHTNIVLPAGTYCISFNPMTQKITITK